MPFAWFFYAETAGRDLEEIDLIFAKAHIERKWPYQVANDMPKLNIDQIAEMSAEVGLSVPDRSFAARDEKTELAVSSNPSEEKQSDN